MAAFPVNNPPPPTPYAPPTAFSLVIVMRGESSKAMDVRPPSVPKHLLYIV